MSKEKDVYKRQVLYNQALLLEGFNVENPAEFIKNLNSLIK